jgi:cell division protein FtsW
MTCIALGIIINVTKKDDEIALEIKDKARRDAALQKIIDKQLLEDEEEESEVIIPEYLDEKNYSIKETNTNPMKVVLDK